MQVTRLGLLSFGVALMSIGLSGHGLLRAGEADVADARQDSLSVQSELLLTHSGAGEADVADACEDSLSVQSELLLLTQTARKKCGIYKYDPKTACCCCPPGKPREDCHVKSKIDGTVTWCAVALDDSSHHFC